MDGKHIRVLNIDNQANIDIEFSAIVSDLRLVATRWIGHIKHFHRRHLERTEYSTNHNDTNDNANDDEPYNVTCPDG